MALKDVAALLLAATIGGVIGVAVPIALFSGPANGPTYDSLSAADKMDVLWSRVVANTTSAPWPPAATVGPKLLGESMQPTVQFVSDELPEGRTKIIHSVAAVAQVRFVFNGAGNYTGVLGSGAERMILRASSANEPDITKEGTAGNLAPAIAMKVLRDGLPSADMFAMFSTGEQLANPNWNYFERQLSTHASGVGGNAAVGAKFGTVSQWTHFLGTSGLATHDSNGNKAEKPNYPFQLVFVPGEQVVGRFPAEYSEYFTDQLASLPPDTIIYEVYAKDTPGAHPIKIGDIQLVTRFTKSVYGDTKLFFKHTTFDEDIKMGAPQEECPNSNECPTCPADFDCFAA